MKKYIIVFFLCLLFGVTSVRAEVTAELLQAIDLVYAASFGPAKTIIDQYMTAHPKDPAGYLVRGMYFEWYQLVRNRGKTLEKQIVDDYQKARELAEEALKRAPSNANTKMMLGNAYMYISKKQLDAGHKMQAASSLKQSRRLLEEVIARDPANAEAYFAVGLFNYFAANVPPGFKWLATLMGFKGNAAKGIDCMKKAAATNNLTQKDALYMLFYVYSRKEGRYAEAFPYAKQLLDRYPRNPVFLFDYAEMLFRTKKIAEARASFNQFFGTCQARRGTCSQEQIFLANYFMAWSYMDEKDKKAARPYVEEAVKLDVKRFKDRTADLKKWSAMVSR